MNHNVRVIGLDFDTPSFHEGHPDDPLDFLVWVTAEVGDERGGALFQIHICTPASIKRIENKRHCFLIQEYVDKADLIEHLNRFINEKTKNCRDNPYWELARFWRYEWGKYDDRGQLIGW